MTLKFMSMTPPKILPHDSNYTLDVVMSRSFGNFGSTSMKKVNITSNI